MWNSTVQAQEIISLFGQETFEMPSEEYVASLKHYGTSDGLIHREVSYIYQDSRGFMWLGTPQGLNRFDGYTFKKWTKIDGLFAKNAKPSIEDSEGNLWLIYEKGNLVHHIDLLHLKTGKVIPFTEKFGTKLPFSIKGIYPRFVSSTDGTIYFLNQQQNQLISYHHQKGFFVVPLDYTYPLNLIGFSSPNKLIANFNNFWTPEKFYQDTLIEFNLKGEILRQKAFDIHLELMQFFLKNGAYWFYGEPPSGNGIFFRVDTNNTARVLPVDSLKLPKSFFKISKNNSFRVLDYDSKTETILAIFENVRTVLLENDGSIGLDIGKLFPEMEEDKGVGRRGYFKDKKERYWIGGDFGVYQLSLKNNPFQKHLYQDQNTTNNVNITCRDILDFEDEIYVATERFGLRKLNQNVENAIIYTNNLQFREGIRSLCKHSTGSLYASGFVHLYQLDQKESILKQIKNKGTDNFVIWSMFEDKYGNFWLGTEQGLKIYSPSDKTILPYTNYHQFTALKTATILDIQKDRQGNIYLSTNNGFYHLDIEKGITARYWSGGKGEYFIPSDNIQHFYQDAEGIFWLATGGEGLIRWDKINQQWKQFTTSDGLPHNIIYAVYEDDFGKLWMSSDAGIGQFDKKSFLSRSFLVKDGITHEEFNRLSHFQDKDGTIYFGGLNGVTAFHPKDFQQLDSIPDSPLRITEFSQFDGAQNQLVDKTGELIQSKHIEMLPDDRFFLLRFALLTYEETKKIGYAYKIEGIDEDWNEQKENFIRLSRLPYGHHILKIKGQAAGGKWSSQELHLTISVLKPFYLTVWFLGLSFLLLIAGFYIFYRFKVNRKLERQENQKFKEMDALKSRLYTYISHEFRTPLTVIIGMAAYIKNQPREKKLIQRNGQNLLSLVNQLLDLSKLDAGGLNLKLKQGDIVTYLQYLVESFYSAAEDKKIRLVFDSEEKSILMDYDEVRIQQIIYNLISNALKFTRKMGRVIVYVQHIEKNSLPFLQIRVKDSGIGIAAQKIPHIFDRFYQIDDSNT